MCEWVGISFSSAQQWRDRFSLNHVCFAVLYWKITIIKQCSATSLIAASMYMHCCTPQCMVLRYCAIRCTALQLCVLGSVLALPAVLFKCFLNACKNIVHYCNKLHLKGWMSPYSHWVCMRRSWPTFYVFSRLQS